MLSVGRVDEAGSRIKQALSADPANSGALSLQAIIAVVQNDKEGAMEAANKAVAADPASATAQIALSYAQQAGFDLESARASLEKAVELEPENALAWARLAELRSSFGDLGKSLEAAQKAVELNPNLSRTQTVLGFAYLTQIKTAVAREAFNRAIELDQADSLPRLGLGLAKIRDGELEDGRREIEIAASLDSNSSLIRSYLGKAYYEEKRTDLDGREYAIAKELDPNDPTPWFYDAIRKQTINRPVEALHDLQTAIGLNDNRAVYRSKLMLDSDLAARSASLARIYSDLGFQQRALVEGYNSVNTDPTNYSAHRFLADSYAALPRHEIARVSELLQSQLLQPINITPIQPWLAESNLPIISAGGPTEVSFNEFNPLFNRNRFALQATALAGENDTYGGEAIVSGIHQKFSFSAGYSQSQTDGFRVNNDQEDDIANVFAQMELTPNTSIQAEYRYRNTDRGDTSLAFYEDDFLPNIRQEDETDVVRLGFRHGFKPGSDLIGNFSYQTKDTSLVDTIDIPPPPFPLLDIFTIKGDETGYNAELQYIYRSHFFNITSGIGYVNIDGEFTYIDDLYDPSVSPPFPLGPSTITEDADVDHKNLYLYSNLYPIDNLTLTIGASGDFYEDENFDKDEFNPKFGFIWNPVVNTTLRGSLFWTVKRTLITNQTLEPTQIAGFNQFFDDANGTDSRNYGLGVDQKFSNDIFGGLEFTKRDLNVPYMAFVFLPPPAPPVIQASEVDWEESIARAYLYWTPYKWLGLRAEYLYEEFDRDQEFVAGTKNVKTHRFPLGVSFFHSSGLTAVVQGTYYDQEGEFLRQDEMDLLNFVSGEDQFWVVDLSLSYRLPKRYGFITVGANNLFDEEFNYQDTDPASPSIQPDRMIYGQVTLTF